MIKNNFIFYPIKKTIFGIIINEIKSYSIYKPNLLKLIIRELIIFYP